MTTILKIQEYNDQRMAIDCIVIQSDDPAMYKGKRFFVDLTVDAGFGEMLEKDLVGKTVVVDRFQPYELIGIGVKLTETF